MHVSITDTSAICRLFGVERGVYVVFSVKEMT